MGKKDSLKRIIEEFPEGATHQFVITAIFGGKEGEPLGAHMNERVAQNQDAAFAAPMQRDLAGSRSRNFNHFKIRTDSVSVRHRNEFGARQFAVD